MSSFRDKMREKSRILQEAQQERQQQKKVLKGKLSELNALMPAVPQYVVCLPYDHPDYEYLTTYTTSEYRGVIGYQQQLLRGSTRDSAYNDSTNRVRLYTDKNPEWICDRLMEIARNTHSELVDVELGWAEKFGPFFLRPVKEWADKRIFKLFAPKHYQPNVEILAKVTDRLVDAITEDGLLCLLAPDSTYEYVAKGKNSGYPFYTSKWEQKPLPSESGYDSMLDYINTVFSYDSVGNGLGAPHVMYTRTRPDGQIASERAVQCPELLEKFVSTRVRKPLTDRMKTLPEFRGLNGIYTMGDVFTDAAPEFKYHIMTDYSSFDANLHPDFIEYIIHEVIAKCFAVQNNPIFANLARYMTTSWLVSPMGIINSSDGRHGLFSGDGLTSLIGCIANYIAVSCAMEELGVGIDDWYGFYFGDDGALFTNVELNLTHLSDVLANYSVTMSVEKTTTKGINFLGHYFVEADSYLNPVYPIMRGAPSFVWYERHPETNDGWKQSLTRTEYEITRLIGKLDVCRNHPNWKELVSFVRDGAPLRLASWAAQPSAIPQILEKKDGWDPSGYYASPTLNLIAELEAAEGLVLPSQEERRARLLEVSEDPLTESELKDWNRLTELLPAEAEAKVLRHSKRESLQELDNAQKRKALARYAKLLRA